MSATTTEVNLKDLQAANAEFNRRWRDRGGKCTHYRCAHCSQDVAVRRPTQKDVGSKGCWDSMTTCIYCGKLNFVATYPDGRTVVFAPEHAATPPSNAALQFPARIEQYSCPSCEGVIAPHLVFSDYPKPTPADPSVHRRTRIFCPHCNAVFQRSFVLRFGEYQPEGDVARVTNARELRGVLARVDQLLNTQRLQSA